MKENLKKNLFITCLILIITVSAVFLVTSWQRNNDASRNPNLIVCENHIDLDLDMACDKCAKILSNEQSNDSNFTDDENLSDERNSNEYEIIFI